MNDKTSGGQHHVLTGILFMLAAFVPRFGIGMLRTHRLGTQILRSALLMTSNLSFFFAIITIPIAKAASISLTAPLERNPIRSNRARFDLIGFSRTGDACCRRHNPPS